MAIANPEHPDSIVIGESTAINWTVVNQSNNDITQRDWFDGVYLSRDAAFDPNEDMLVRDNYHSDSLVSGGSYDSREFITINQLPNSLSPYDLTADWHLIINTDIYNSLEEPDSLNNTKAIPIELLAPDLTIADAQTPSSASVNSTIPVSWTVDNLADIPALTNWVDGVYLSDDNVLGGEEDIWLTDLEINESIP